LSLRRKARLKPGFLYFLTFDRKRFPSIAAREYKDDGFREELNPSYSPATVLPVIE